MREALADYEATGSRMLLHCFLSLLADVEMRLDHRSDALTAVIRGLSECASTGERFWEAELHRQHAELLRSTAPAEAAAGLDRALAVARAQSAVLFEARVLELMRGRGTSG